ncbi:MAG: hypothetical protein JRI39_08640 [Deltaproteobacteria bacterium]|nr:hypothetical protein [Deltaproteobacteria bacterium]
MKTPRIRFTVFLLLSAWLLYGCGLTSFVAHPFGGHKTALKKRLMVTPLVDQAGLGQQVTDSLYQDLIRALSIKARVIIVESHDATYTQQSQAGISYGIRPDESLLSKAREMGINAVLTGIISPIEKEERLRGIWPFRKAVSHYSLALVFNLVDPQNGTVILSNMESGGTSIDLGEEEFTEKSWILEELKQEVLPKLLKKSIEPLKEALESERWEGKILAVDHQIRINAGADVGVEPGYRFDVYGGSEVVRAKDGRQFLVSWQKVGSIRVTQVDKNTSVAEPIEGKGFEPGQKIISID